MSLNLEKRDLFNLEFQPGDRALLETIAQKDGNTSMGAIIRRLIRQEAERRGIALPSTVSTEQPA